MAEKERLLAPLWEGDHSQIQIYEGYTKNTKDSGIEFITADHNDTLAQSGVVNHNVESWSLVLYLICFLVLILFFLIISAMEVCCKRTVLNVPTEPNQSTEVSPPPYDLFGPPTYDSLYDPECRKKGNRKRKFSIFVIHLPKRNLTFDLTRLRRENASSTSSTEAQGEISPPPPP